MCSSSSISTDDRISMLGDEVLGLILSHLTFKEHVATSILSRRWRYLWTSTTTKLDFDGTDTLVRLYDKYTNEFTPEEMEEYEAEEEKEKLKFVRWVNHVLKSRKRSVIIEDFKLHFSLGINDTECITEWLRYALAHKVQTLELDLTNPRHLAKAYQHYIYVFPYELLKKDSSKLGGMLHFKQLKKVLLSSVHVDDESLEFFLHNCPLLEDLSVSYSSKLSTLRVIGPLPSLKRLQISECNPIHSLQICDVNHLVYLSFDGGVMHLQNLPMLVNLSVSAYVLQRPDVQFSSILEQLEILNLDVWRDNTIRFPVKMGNLKQLVVGCDIDYDESFLSFTKAIHDSAPCLQKFTIEVLRFSSKYFEGELPRKKMEKEVYPELKEVKLVGFRGMHNDFEFVFHFVDNAHALKKIIIDPKFPEMDCYDQQHLKTTYEKNDVMTALDRAEKKLVEDVPSNIQVEFLSRF